MNNPFRYVPSEQMLSLAENLSARIASDPILAGAFGEGKMLGILRTESCVLYGFSGNAGGTNTIEGFVPPVFDLLEPEGRFKKEEKEISEINAGVIALEKSPEMTAARQRAFLMQARLNGWIHSEKEKMARNKAGRAEDRAAGRRPEEELTKESQFEKAEFRRGRKALEAQVDKARCELNGLEEKVRDLKNEMKTRSDILQKWIFDQFILHNASGETKTITEIFAGEGIVAPGGTGECAGIKLLEYAYRNGLKPVEIGEFWYGETLGDGLRTHGRFYPSCSSKCGPLLRFMLQGLDIEDENAPKNYSLIYQDRDVVVVEKPSGMLSVPGKTVGKSLLEYLQEDLNGDILPVHRLDMDTSGLMVFARNAETQAELGRQFEERTTGKTYVAVVDGNVEKDSGEICLGIAPDWENRPRQMVSADGRQARTIFKVSRHLSDGRTEVFLKPLTGRTHQLRVHCAHPEGLGHPISGDRLYGSKKTDALLLHATHLEFDLRSERLSFDSPRPSYWPEN